MATPLMNKLLALHAQAGQQWDRHMAGCPNDHVNANLIRARMKGIGQAINVVQQHVPNFHTEAQLIDQAWNDAQSYIGAGTVEAAFKAGWHVACAIEHRATVQDKYEFLVQEAQKAVVLTAALRILGESYDALSVHEGTITASM